MWARFVWMNGELIEWEKARAHLAVGGLLYGLCVWEGIRAYSTKDNLNIFKLKEHVDRLFGSARIFQMSIPFNKQDLHNAVIDVIKQSNIHHDCYVRPIVYRGELASLGVKQTFDAPVEVGVIAQLRKRRISQTTSIEGKRAIVSSWRRPGPDSMPLKAKCAANYVNSALAIMDANRASVDYPIFLDSRGFVSEGFAQNLFIVKERRCKTPPLNASILEGITRNTVIQLARDLGYDTVEENFARDELYTADEVFLCGTACEIVPIVKIDGIAMPKGVGKITAKIAQYYIDVVNGKIDKYRKWITKVY